MAVKNPTTGLVRLTDTEPSLSTMQSLAQNDAVILDTTYATQSRGFLLKRWRKIIDMELAPLRLNCLIGVLAPGASAAEAETGIEVNVQTGADFSDWANIFAQEALIWNTLVSFGAPAGHIDNNDVVVDTGWVTCGKKGKGIPYMEGVGPQTFLYNLGAALPADVEVNYLNIYEGVYLSD